MHAMDSGAPATGAGRAARLQDAMPRDAAAADAVGCPLDRAPTRRLEGANRNRGARAGATKEFRHSSGECMHAAQAHARLNSRRRGSRCALRGAGRPTAWPHCNTTAASEPVRGEGRLNGAYTRAACTPQTKTAVPQGAAAACAGLPSPPLHGAAARGCVPPTTSQLHASSGSSASSERSRASLGLHMSGLGNTHTVRACPHKVHAPAPMTESYCAETQMQVAVRWLSCSTGLSWASVCVSCSALWFSASSRYSAAT